VPIGGINWPRNKKQPSLAEPQGSPRGHYLVGSARNRYNGYLNALFDFPFKNQTQLCVSAFSSEAGERQYKKSLKSFHPKQLQPIV
jgi:hypothetical protein